MYKNDFPLPLDPKTVLLVTGSDKKRGTDQGTDRAWRSFVQLGASRESERDSVSNAFGPIIASEGTRLGP